MLPRATALIALVGLALALVLATGCGGGGSDSARGGYVDTLNEAQTSLQRRFTDIGKRITPTSTPKQDQRSLAAYEQVVTSTVADLRSIDPPTGLGALHRRFIADLSDYAAAVQDARERLASGDRRQVLSVQSRLNAAVGRAGQRLNATIDAINKSLKG